MDFDDFIDDLILLGHKDVGLRMTMTNNPFLPILGGTAVVFAVLNTPVCMAIVHGFSEEIVQLLSNIRFYGTGLSLIAFTILVAASYIPPDIKPREKPKVVKYLPADPLSIFYKKAKRPKTRSRRSSKRVWVKLYCCRVCHVRPEASLQTMDEADVHRTMDAGTSATGDYGACCYVAKSRTTGVVTRSRTARDHKSDTEALNEGDPTEHDEESGTSDTDDETSTSEDESDSERSVHEE